MNFTMQELVRQAIRDLRGGLLAPHELSRWNSLNINYHLPHVSRLWRQWGDGYRLSLHRTECVLKKDFDPRAQLYHTHAVPQAVLVFKGQNYWMVSGSDEGSAFAPPHPSVVSNVSLAEGQKFYYEMTSAIGWHAIAAIDAPAFSIMLTGKPYGHHHAPKSPTTLEPLDAKIVDHIATIMRNFVHSPGALDF